MIRYQFLDESLREEDIHPDNIFKNERKLAYQSVNSLKSGEGIEPCPVCQAKRQEVLFTKWGFRYAICPETWSISLADMPKRSTIIKYFFDSDLSRLRASSEYQHQATQKRKDLWENFLGWMEGRISRYMGNDKYKVLDWGAKYTGWIDFLSTAPFVEEIAVEDPLPPITQEEQNFKSADIISLMDVMQRVSNPQDLMQKISHKLRPGGILVAACRAGSGFDILTLRENSESIFPLDHIYLPSPQGLKLLLEKSGFEVLEITTPGVFDVQYIKNAVDSIPSDQYFQRYIFNAAEGLFIERLQGFLQRNNLSSHLRCVARRR